MEVFRAVVRSVATSHERPGGDEGVDFAHEADGFLKGDDDFLVLL